MESILTKHLDYDVKLSSFDGPLDALLGLVKNAKIDIKDIFISEVTEQFLGYMDQLDEIDMDSASEFLEMAATLLEIKSKALLPRIEEETPDEEDPAKKLIRQLEEYKLFKEAGEKLKEQETVNRFYKEPDDSAFEPQYILKDMNLEGLLNAFSKLLAKIDKRDTATNAPKEIKKDTITVAEQMNHIRDLLVDKKDATFFSLFEEGYGRLEVITTFQAILELLKMQIISAVQSDVFEDISLQLKADTEDAKTRPLQIDKEMI